MSWEPRPLPEQFPETSPYWAAAARGELRLPECRDCGDLFFYPRGFCPDCLSEDLTWRELSGEATVHTYTVLDHVAGWPEEALPAIYAYVDLAEGVRLPTNVVDADPADVSVGTPVDVRFVPTDEDDVAIPVFAPADEAGHS